MEVVQRSKRKRREFREQRKRKFPEKAEKAGKGIPYRRGKKDIARPKRGNTYIIEVSLCSDINDEPIEARYDGRGRGKNIV